MNNRTISHAVRSTLLRQFALGSTLAIAATLALADAAIVLKAAGDNASTASEIVTSSEISVNGDVVIAQSDSPATPGSGQRIQRIETFKLSDGADINFTVSNALSHAFRPSAGTGTRRASRPLSQAAARTRASARRGA